MKLPITNFDMVRVTMAKATVDVCSNTIRAYHKMGLPLYQCGRAKFFSKMELEQFIRLNVVTKVVGEHRPTLIHNRSEESPK